MQGSAEPHRGRFSEKTRERKPVARYVALRPYGNWWFARTISFSNGVVFDRLPRDVRPRFDGSSWAQFFSQKHIHYLSEVNYWMCRFFDDEEDSGSAARATAIQQVDNVALAFLVDCPAELNPTEFQEMTAICELRQDRLIPSAVGFHQPYYGFPWARVLRESRFAEGRVGSIAEGIEECIAKRVVRLVNAFRLLELGLQATEPYIKLLLWVVALDSLLMAITSDNFVSRLQTFLGADSLVFPASGLRHPGYTVADVAFDLYDLRCAIAHGTQIPEKYWQAPTYVSKSWQSLERYPNCARYRDLLSGCALFLLCAALRKIYIEGLVDTAADSKAWRDLLDRGAPARK